MHWVSKFFILLLLSFSVLMLSGQVKETHQIIEEWVKTKQLLSEEKSAWKSEKAALTDLEDALAKEIAELEVKLGQFEKENIGAARKRADLAERKKRAQAASLFFYEGMNKIETEIKATSNLLPTPLRDRLSTFFEKIDFEQNESLPLRKRLEGGVAILQAIHLFHRAVHLEKQEFKLADGQSREFRVIYFGLGVAYFVNESGSVAGWGKPDKDGWKWTREDGLAREISAGVSILENRALPRFLELPFSSPPDSEK